MLIFGIRRITKSFSITVFLIEECRRVCAGKIINFFGIFAVVSVSAFLIPKLMAKMLSCLVSISYNTFY